MELELTNKAVLVTGSTRGIGKSIAEAFCAEGCRVAINGRNNATLRAVAAELSGTLPICADATQPEQAQQMIAEVKTAFGQLDILVCNVGSGSSVPPGNESFEEWQRIFAINLWSATNTIEAAQTTLANSNGTIVCISSICGHEVIPGAPVTYSVSKAALNAYVKGISRPLGEQGVRINAVAPGNILFEGSVWSRKLSEDADSVQSMLRREVPLSKLGSPSDVANLVTYLASPVAGFATGGVWTLDGGQVRS